MAVVLDWPCALVGPLAYALPFAVSGALRRGRDGRPAPPAPAGPRHRPAARRGGRGQHDARAEPLPARQRDQRAGHGLRAVHSVFIISVLGMSAGFSMLVGLDRDADHGRGGRRRRHAPDPRLVVAQCCARRLASARWRWSARSLPCLASAFAPMFVIARRPCSARSASRPARWPPTRSSSGSSAARP